MSIGRSISAALFLSVAAVWAVPTWFPSRFTKPARPNADLDGYLRRERLDIADSIHVFGTVEVDGIHLAVHSWIPAHATGTVFLVHGYYNQSGVWSEHVKRLLARNVGVVALDLPGHGLSDGHRMDIDSFGQYSKGLRALEDSMRSRAPQPWSLVGHSLGGSIALDRARQKDFPYSKVLLIAPMARYNGWTWSKILMPGVSLFKDYLIRNRNLASSSDTNFLSRLKSDPLEGWVTSINWLKQVRIWNASMEGAHLARVDWMLIQGGLDQTVDWKWGLPWLKTLVPGLKVRYFPFARHHIHNEGGLTGETVRHDFDDFLAPTSSQEAI